MSLFGFNKQKTKIKKRKKSLLHEQPSHVLLFICSLAGNSSQLGLKSFLQISVFTLWASLSIQRCPWCLPCFYPNAVWFFKNPFLSPDEIVIFCTRLISQGKQSRKPVSGTKQEQNKSTVVFLKYVHLNTFNLTWGWTLPVNIYFAGEI